MKITKIIEIVAVAGIVGIFAPAIASARTHVSIGIGIGYPAYGYYGPPHYNHHPRAFYMAPPPPRRLVFVPIAPVIVAPPPVIVTQPVVTVPDSVYVNVANSNGSITPVLITRSGNFWVGPKGEMYTTVPAAEQLRPIYGF